MKRLLPMLTALFVSGVLALAANIPLVPSESDIQRGEPDCSYAQCADQSAQRRPWGLRYAADHLSRVVLPKRCGRWHAADLQRAAGAGRLHWHHGCGNGDQPDARGHGFVHSRNIVLLWAVVHGFHGRLGACDRHHGSYGRVSFCRDGERRRDHQRGDDGNLVVLLPLM